jgi:adenosylmethionine---8-amino-7-oxononanoate aminotransferase
MNILAVDSKHIWHPFTQEKTADPCICITKACGAKIYDTQGQAYLDLISSWWVNLHGHAHPKIAASIARQAQKLEHVIFAGFTHEPAVKLVVELQKFLPPQLEKFFFSDNGSTCVEIALKIAYQYWRNLGDNNRKRFVAFTGGYHGDTFGAMSVGKSSGFFSGFSELFFQVDFLPYVATWIGDDLIREKENAAFLAITSFLEKHHQEIAALIIEPLIQGAAGMLMMRAEFLEKIVKLAKSYEILIIFDEVMTGFGRTGKMFAFWHLESFPDILCLSKGLTGGFLPLSLTITTKKIYNAFLHDDFMKSFIHGHSYTANPLGCAAGIASLGLFTEEKTLEKIKKIEIIHREYLSWLAAEIEEVAQIRCLGSIAAFKLNLPDNVASSMQIIRREFLKRGILLRPLGEQIYLLPPYCIAIEDLLDSYRIIAEVLKKFLAKK